MDALFSRILLAVDLNEDAPDCKLVQAAIVAARSHKASLHVMTVVPSLGSRLAVNFFPDTFEEQLLEVTRKSLHDFTVDFPDDLTLQHIVAEGTIYERILAVAKEIGADMIFVGSHRPELSDYLIGPNAARIVRHAGCSVTVVR